MLFKVLLIGGLLFLLYRTITVKSLPNAHKGHANLDKDKNEDEEFVDYEEVE